MTSSLDFVNHSHQKQVNPLQRIVDLPQPKKAIRELSRLELFSALKNSDTEMLLEVLPHISDQQLTGILDFDAWDHDDINLESFAGWLKPYFELDPTGKQAYQRFTSLEEEYQIAVGSGLIQTIELEDFERLTSSEQDSYTTLPCNELFVRINSEHEGVVDFFEHLLKSLMNVNMEYAYSYIAHCHHMPPNETKHQLSRFRNARLEEDGFVAFDESLRILAPVASSAIKLPENVKSQNDLPSISNTSELQLLNGVLSRLYDTDRELLERFEVSFNAVANGLCSVCQVKPNQIDKISTLIEIAKSYTNLSLSSLSHGDLDVAAEICKLNHPQILFRHGLHLLRQEQRKGLLTFFAATDKPFFASVDRLFRQQKWVLLHKTIVEQLSPTLSHSKVEDFCGLFHEFPYLSIYDEKKETYRQRYISSTRELSSWRSLFAEFAELIEEGTHG